MNTLQEFWKQHQRWGAKTMESIEQHGPMGLLKHVTKEAVEAQNDSNDLEE